MNFCTLKLIFQNQKNQFLRAKVDILITGKPFLRAKNHFAKLKNELLHAKISPEGPERSAEGLREEKNGFGEGGEAVCLEKTVYLPPNPPCRKPRRAGTGDFVQK